MSNEIRTLVKFEWYEDSVLDSQRPGKAYSVATSSELKNMTTQVVGTTHEAIAAGDVTDDAFALIENTHATAIVSVGGDDTGAFVEWFTIAPGDPPAIMPRVSALAATYLKSDTASTPVRVTLIKVVAPA